MKWLWIAAFLCTAMLYVAAKILISDAEGGAMSRTKCRCPICGRVPQVNKWPYGEKWTVRMTCAGAGIDGHMVEISDEDKIASKALERVEAAWLRVFGKGEK